MRAGRRIYYGWSVVAVGALVAFCSGPGQSYVFSVFLDSIIEATGFTRTGVSTLYAIGTGISALMVGVVSRMADRYGPRMMLIAVAFALGLACFGMALATGPIAIFLAFASLRALGQGSLPVNATLLVAQWFVRYRGRAMSVVALGFAASNALIPPISRYLIETIGWRGAYAALGVMVWLLIIPAGILVVRNQPDDMGLYPDGADEPPEGEMRLAAVQRSASRKVFSSLPFWMLAIPLSAPSFIVTALVFHQVSIFDERGLSATVAAGVFIPYAIASAGTNILAGILVDRLDPKRLFAANLTVLLAAMLWLLVVSSPTGAIVYAAILGIAGGMQSIISGVIWAYYYGRHGLGRVQGSAMMVSITGAALGPLPLAALYQLTGDYTLGIGVMVALLLASLGMAVFLSPKPEALQEV